MKRVVKRRLGGLLNSKSEGPRARSFGGATLTVVNVHRHFEAEANIVVGRNIPLHFLMLLSLARRMGNIHSPRGVRFPSDCRRHRACTLCAKHTLLVSCDVAEKNTTITNAYTFRSPSPKLPSTPPRRYRSGLIYDSHRGGLFQPIRVVEPMRAKRLKR